MHHNTFTTWRLISSIVIFLVAKLVYHAIQDSNSMSTPSWWEPTTSLYKPLGKQVAVTYDGVVFIIGGIDRMGVYSSGVFSSTIRPGGGLGPWLGDQNGFRTAEGPPLPIGYAATAIDNTGWTYVTGGYSGGDFLSSTYFAKLDNKGVISPWKRAGFDFPKRDLHASVIVGNELYVLGGWNGNSILDDVLYSHITRTGTLEHSWMPTAKLKPGRFAHAAVSYGQLIYVIGGRILDINGDRIVTNSVQYALVDNGIIGDWKQTTSLPRTLSDLSAVVSEEGTIYVIGGRNSEIISNKVYSATILDDSGKLTERWEDISATRGLTLPLEPGLHSHTAIYSNIGSIYVLGGRTNNLGEKPAQYVSNVFYNPPLNMVKSSDPSGPVHEGDVITYTISYANTGLIPQTNIVITDKIPSNTDLVTGTISSGGTLMHNGVISWTRESLAVGETRAVSFQVQIPLLRHLEVESVSPLCTPTPTPPPPSRVLPAAISCDTTRFWAHGITRQPSVSPPYTIEVQIPPNTSPSEMWLLMKGAGNTAPRVEGQPAHVLTSTHNAFGASVWTTTVTSAMIEAGEVTVVTDNPRELNALFLFDAKDPPFDERDLRVFAEAPTTFTYTLEIPSVEASTMDVLLPFMDITYWTDSSPPEFDGRMITVTAELEGEPSQTILANQPNMGNGLLMTQFPINLRPFTDTITKTKVLTITVDSEDDAVYTLGPRVCRPVYVENTAWLCSDRAGCISATTRNIPENFAPLSIYLPIILKSYP
jgi:uncharacterized repeat protein (TIGR01451 family)